MALRSKITDPIFLQWLITPQNPVAIRHDLTIIRETVKAPPIPDHIATVGVQSPWALKSQQASWPGSSKTCTISAVVPTTSQ